MLERSQVKVRIFILAILISPGFAMAQNFSMNADVSRSRSLVDQKDAGLQESNDFGLGLSYSFEKLNLATLQFGYGQDLRNPEDSSPYDVVLNLAHKVQPNYGYSNYNFAIAQIIPASKDSRDRQELHYGVKVMGQMLSKPETILHGKMSLLGQLAFTRFFHEHDIANDETQNNEYSSSQSIQAAFTFSKLRISLDITHRNTWSYHGVGDQKYQHSEEISLALTKKITIYLGHTLAQPDYKETGDSNVAIMNDDNSRIYIGMALAI